MSRPSLRDAQMKATRALPNGAAAVTQATGLDLQNSTRGDFVANCELLLSAPAMNTTQMPNAKTMIYDIVMSDSSDLSGPTTLIAAAITQTGAGGAGCAAATYRMKPPTNVKRYVGLKATGSAAGDATGATATLEVLF